MSRRSLLLSFVLSLAMGCSPSPADPPSSTARPVPGGAFTLTAWDGRPVPVDMGDLPSRTGEPAPPCHWFVSDGHLVMDPDYRVFDLVRQNRNCVGRVLSRSTTTGVYRVVGDRVVFSHSALLDDEPDFTFLGRIVDDGIVVTGYGVAPLTFSGAWVRHRPRGGPLGEADPPRRALHALVKRNGTPVQEDPRPGVGCTRGSLIMEPDDRVFELEVQRQETCGRSPPERTRWFGAYGQTGARLTFVHPSATEDEPDVRFYGRVRNRRIEITAPDGSRLAFVAAAALPTW